MNLYLIYLVSPVLIWGGLNFFRVLNVEQRTNIFIKIMSILMFFFMAFRSQYIGSGDAIIYFRTWERFASTDDLAWAFSTSSMERGFLLFVYGLSRVFRSGQFMFVFSSLIITVCISKFIKENCKDYLMAFLTMNALGLYTFFLQGIRQGIAIAICLYSVKFCRRKQLIYFLLFLILAMSFHGSAVVFLPVYFAYGFKFKPKTVAIISIGTIALFWSLNRFMGIVNRIMDESYLIGMTNLTTGGTQTMIIYIGVLIFAILFRPDSTNESLYREYSFFLALSYLAVLLFSMRFYVNTIIERVSYYFTYFIPCLFSECKNSKRLPLILYLAVYIVFFALAIYKGITASTFIPFLFFWQA